jgi:hypothetical protein
MGVLDECQPGSTAPGQQKGDHYKTNQVDLIR